MVALPIVRVQSVRTRALGLLSLLFLTLLSPPPASAVIDWCSADPLFSLYHEDQRSLQLVDVQVLVPLSALPLAAPATLAAQVPSNVDGEVLLSTSTPIFEIVTTVESTLPADTSGSFPLQLVLEVPTKDRAFPVRLLITNPSTGTITTVDGTAGTPLRTIVEVKP